MKTQGKMQENYALQEAQGAQGGAKTTGSLSMSQDQDEEVFSRFAHAQQAGLLSRGFFLSLEGIDGCGKSTQAKLLCDFLTAHACRVDFVRDPGTTLMAEKIRHLLLDPKNAEMSRACELLLYEAARADLASQRIKPALAQGSFVICDRFADSTLAYQAFGHGFPKDEVLLANTLGSAGQSPDLSFFFDLLPEAALIRREARRKKTNESADRLEAEGLGLQRRVRDGYLNLYKEHPERIVRLDGSLSQEELFDLCKRRLSVHLERFLQRETLER